MANVLIAFASMSGNTEELAYLIEERLREEKIKVTVKQIGYDKMEIDAFSQFDGIALGTYTEGDGDIPYEAEDFYDELDEADWTGKPVALFGSCDSMYPYYGGAIDQFEDRLIDLGAVIMMDSLKVELSPDKEDEKRCRDFAGTFAEALSRQASLPGR